MYIKLSLLFFAWCYMMNKSASGFPESSCQFYYNKALKKNVYTSVDKEPEFAGGMAGYQRFLNRNLRISNEMIDSDQAPIQYPVMQFIVDIDGQIKNIRVNNKEQADEMDPMEKETFRLIKLMPDWTPAICQNKAVAAEIKRPLVICILLEKE